MPSLRPRRVAALMAAALVLALAVLAAGPAGAATPSQPPRFVAIPGTLGLTFANYDFTTPSVGADNADWPVNLVFTGDASVARVKAALSRAFPWPGSVEWGLIRAGAGAPVPDPDLGRKTRLCSLATPSVHFRLYAPLGLSFTSLLHGRYVVGTAHLDVGECGPGPVFGWSEEAEGRVAAAAAGLGWRVLPGFPLGNPEPDRWEGPPTSGFPGNHFWQGNGVATRIVVP